MALAPATPVSLVIPVHCKPQRLALTLAAVQGQDGIGDVEVLLVADNPSPAVAALLATPSVGRVIASPGLGRAGARNLGARAARGDLLVFIDDDILLERDFLARHRAAQARTPGLVHGQLREIPGLSRIADPAAGGPGCAPVSAAALRAGAWQPEGIRLLTNALAQAIEHADAARWPWLAAGANLSVPRRHWQQVGGFDASYGTRWGMEDIDFAYRLWAAGVPVMRAPEARGYHMSHGEAARWDDHHVNLRKFQRLANCPEALALDALLSANGSVQRYRQRIDQIRQTAAPCAAPL